MDLPPLDCHAHISIDVTERQLGNLGNAVIFGMTRSPAEAFEATQRYDKNVVWACGAHPAFVASGGEVSLDQFARRVDQFALVGEVGLDRRSGNLERQIELFKGLLDRVEKLSVLVSIHSAGCSSEIVQELAPRDNNGSILHWFTGTIGEAAQLVRSGCYFSVNSVMKRSILETLPLERVLPETDFPVANKRTGSKPGDTRSIEAILAEIHNRDQREIRNQLYRNLRRISVASGAIDRMPVHLVELLMLA